MKLCRLLLLAVLATGLTGCASTPDAADDPDITARELYEKAKAADQRGDYETAISLLEQVQSRFPLGVYARQAQLDLIHAHFAADYMESAMSAADRYIRLYPRDEHVVYAYYMRATASLMRGRDLMTRIFDINRGWRDPEPLRQAFGDFRHIVEAFPETEYAEDAQRQMRIIRDLLAAHELHVADYYVRRKAYVAAANRAKGIIQNFQETTAVKDALLILAHAYRELALDDLRADVLRVIELNYPEALEAAEAGDLQS